MKKQIVPGHVRAYTWILALIAGISALLIASTWKAPIGMVLIIIGEFLGNQATHLARHHDELPPTWIEIQMQQRKTLFQFLGLCVIVLGIWVAFRS